MRSRLLVIAVVVGGLTACGSPQAATQAPSADPCPADFNAANAASADANCFADPIDRYDDGSEDLYDNAPDPFSSP